MKQFLLFAALLIGSLAVQAQSIEALRDSMAAGNLNCQVDLAICYLFGDGVELDVEKGVSLIRDAAEKGNRYGELMMGMCYKEAHGVETDYDEAFRWFLSSAQKGNTRAMCMLGEAYKFGQGTEQDLAKAIYYYEQGASGGDGLSQYELGVHYLVGDGIERNWEKSFDLLKKSADQGYPEAFQILALCYFNGWGTQKSQDEAIHCLEEMKQWLDESTIQEIDEEIAQINEGDTLSAYQFQFRTLPLQLAAYANGTINEQELIDLELLKLKLGFSLLFTHYECDLDSLSISTHNVDDSITVHVIHMPEPSRPPLCKYAAYVMDKKNGLSRYYTLEKTYDLFGESDVADPYVVGGMKINDDKVSEASSGSTYPDGFTHLNFGWIEGDPTEENFVNTILRLFKDK
jgi:hypothetical protein